MIRIRSRSSPSVWVGTYCGVARHCPTTRHARRSETENVACAWHTASRRRAGLRSFPRPSPSRLKYLVESWPPAWLTVTSYHFSFAWSLAPLASVPPPIKWKAHDIQAEEDLRRERLRNDRTAARRPLFRGMPAADSERTRKSGRLPVGISGRVPSEWVADLRRNQWPAWVGIRSG